MVTVENNVGRLVEIRQTGRVTIEELQESGQAFGRILATLKGRAILCTDWRGMHILPQPVTEVLLNIMRNENARVERQGVLLDPSAIIGMQLDRLLRTSGNSQTKAFRDADQMQTWLGQVLTLAERTQMRKFLAAAK